MLVGIKKSAYTWTLFRNQGNNVFTIKLQQIKSVFLGHICLKWITTDRGQAFNPVQIAPDSYLPMRENETAISGDGFCVCILFEADEKMGKKTETKITLKGSYISSSHRGNGKTESGKGCFIGIKI